MNFKSRNYLLEGFRKINRKRLYLARYKNTERTTKCRKVICGEKKSRYNKSLKKEGKPISKYCFLRMNSGVLKIFYLRKTAFLKDTQQHI